MTGENREQARAMERKTGLRFSIMVTYMMIPRPDSLHQKDPARRIAPASYQIVIPPAESCAVLPAPPSPPRPPESHGYPPPSPPVSACSYNELGDEGASALSSGLTGLTNLQSIGVG